MLKIKENKLNLFLWFLYSAITFLAVINHEPNRDEAQIWLIVRDLDFSEIFSQLSVKGHPGLWYLILLPFAKCGLPYISMHIVHWFIGILSSALILFYSRLNRMISVLFVFSYFMLFEYIVPARNYSLTILLLSCICCLYEQRFTRPILFSVLVFLLFNTNTHSFGAASALSLIFFLEAYQRRMIGIVKYPLLIMLCGFLLVILQLMPSSAVSPDLTINPSFFPTSFIDSAWVTLTGIQNSFIPIQPEYEELKVALVFTLFFLILLVIQFKKIYPFLFLLISTGWLFFIFCTRHPGSWRHEGFTLVFSFFSMWIAAFYTTHSFSFINYNLDLKLENAYKTFLIVCLIISGIFGLSSLKKEYKYDFSGSKSMAGFIIANRLEGREIACYRSWRASALAPYLPNTKLWFVDRKEYGTYFILDSVFKKDGDSLSQQEVINRIKTHYSDSLLLLLNEPLNITGKNFTSKLLYKNADFIWATNDEYFYLYELKLSPSTSSETSSRILF